jgi:hypothetical protein
MVRPTLSKRPIAIESVRHSARPATIATLNHWRGTNQPPVIAPEKFSSTTLRLSPPAEQARSTSLVQLSRRPPTADGAVKGWASARIEAGYGVPLDELPIPLHGRNGTAWEEPSYGYLMVRFVF